MELDILHIDASIANAFRRAFIAEVKGPERDILMVLCVIHLDTHHGH
jgi:RNA polymerase Rpb3/Rpb11 dimerisation domain